MIKLRTLFNLFEARLSRRIVLWIFLSIVTIEAIILIPAVSRRRADLYQDLESQSFEALNTLALSTQGEISSERLFEMLQMLPLSSVAKRMGVALYDQNGQLLEAFEMVPESHPSDLAPGQKMLGTWSSSGMTYEMIWAGETFAWPYTVVVCWEISQIRRELLLFVIRIIGLVIIISVFVTLVTMLVLQQLLIRPLLKTRCDLLAELTKAPSEIGKIICSQVAQRDDELGDLVGAFNQRTEQLADTIEQLQDQTEKTQSALSELKQTQSRLVHSEKMSSLGQLVAGVAHEINNPVSFIHGNVTHAQDYVEDLMGLLTLYQEHLPTLPPEIQTYQDDLDLDYLTKDLSQLFQSMQSGTRRIQEIVLSLRSFSRLDEAHFKSVDIHDGLESSLMLLRHRLTNTASDLPLIQIAKDYGKAVKVDCFPRQLNQVFMHILSNAVDALEATRENLRDQPEALTFVPTITIITERQADEMVITIADNGHGMSPDILEKAVDPFFTTKPVGQGTGLGLSISHQIITEVHQGFFHCDSSPGKGTQIRFGIPLKQSKPDLAHDHL